MGSASVKPDPLIGTVVGGRYEVVRLIGKGGMGAIYEVRNTRLGRQFALKTLTGDAASNPEVLQRFRREADVIAKIKHPNIVEVIDWESLADGSPAMVMEYLHGEDLGERIKDGQLRWPQLARVADQVLAALSIAHANGIVHRDLKPQNIFLAQDDSGDERVKLLDFGVSKVRDSKSFVTTDARLLGTPAYMSPEQSEGRAEDVGTHSDVWGMGAILYEMATGGVPFDADNLPAILYKICHSKAPPIAKKRADAPAAFVQLIDETFERDINKRISDATVLRVRLREALREVAGVQFVDTLPGLRPSQQLTASGRRKRFTDALDDTLGAKALTPPQGNLAVGTPVEKSVKLGTENTLLATKDTPSVIARKKWRPAAVAVGVLAIATVAGAVVIAMQRGSDGSPAEAHAVAKPADQVPQIDAGAVVATPPPAPDAAVTVAVDPPKQDPPAHDPPKQDPKQKTTKKKDPTTNTAKIDPKQDPAKTEPKQEPAKTEPKQDPVKKKCAKDDVECLYGDGT